MPSDKLNYYYQQIGKTPTEGSKRALSFADDQKWFLRKFWKIVHRMRFGIEKRNSHKRKHRKIGNWESKCFWELLLRITEGRLFRLEKL